MVAHDNMARYADLHDPDGLGDLADLDRHRDGGQSRTPTGVEGESASAAALESEVIRAGDLWLMRVRPKLP